jgi:dienelactone hydrolase
MRRHWFLLVGAFALVSPTFFGTMTGPASAQTPSSPIVCDQPPGDPAPGTAAWEERDLNNIECATQRQQDELTNPDFLAMWAIDNAEADPGFEVSAFVNQLENLTHPVLPTGDVGVTKIGDPFRVPSAWQEAGRGQQMTLTIDATTGAHLNARLYWPNGPGPFPGVVVIPGLQAYNEIYAWLGEGLAESGYMVLIPDPQGQGSSEALPHNPNGSINCSGTPSVPVPPSASGLLNTGCPNFLTNDVPEVQSALDFLVSTPRFPDLDGGAPTSGNARGTLPYNPEWQLLNRSEIGVAGHSMGAVAVTTAGQKDSAGHSTNLWPVKAVVSMDNLGGKVASGVKIHVPALYFDVDYPFPSVLAPQNPLTPPNPSEYINDAFSQTVQAGVDSMVIVPRASTHYEFDYLPFPSSLQASRYGERVAFYYILAWFDKYLDHNIVRGGHSATQRLTATYFDGSADASSIGAGTFNAAAALADPTNPAAGNVPYTIAGKCISNLLSFYYQSAYWLDGGKLKDYRMENPLGCP